MEPSSREPKVKLKKRRFVDAKDPQLTAWWVLIATDAESAIQYPEILTRKREVNGQERHEVLVVGCGFDVTGEYLVKAKPDVDQRGMPCLAFKFNKTGGQLFSGLTGSNLPSGPTNFTRKLGIIFDGQSMSAPAIQSVIFNRGQITGSFTKEQVRDLADILNAGPLPVEIRQLERRAVADVKNPQPKASYP